MMKYCLLALILFSLLSCDSNRLYEKNISIENTFGIDLHKPSFNISIQIISRVNLKVNVRHSSSYPFSNLWLFVNTIEPGGAFKTDTLEITLAQKDKMYRQWIRRYLGYSMPIQSYRFLKQGMYTFEIEQAMRHGDLAKIERLPQ